MIRRSSRCTSLLCVLLVAAASLAAEQRYSRSVESYRPPDVPLVQLSGERVSLTSVLSYNGPVVLQFIFASCPMICPVMTETLAAAREKLGPDLGRTRMVSITIDPENDTPEVLGQYARKFKAGPQWLFLTGTSENITTVQKAFRAYENDKMQHQPLTFLRAAPGGTWVRLNGLMSASQLATEYRRLVRP